ncbi:alpha/beta hydrolase [Humisphaera borealis]|uniref:Alpha/beta hydrolase n=1 Tax=Humisphaera borealis TaxID=2807512 RepID=A0A7M2WT13_9BACT|nr:alpha/beta hydrolase [Humisphaera borealis]QOV87740.1 alpha/beta hydrolase [Humisphaera borealis]
MKLTAVAFALGLCLVSTMTRAADPLTLRLWDGDAPGALGKEASEKPSNDVPTITVYPPPEGKNNGGAIVVCPGGGYGGLAAHEGKPVAEWANSLGMTGVVLRYRLGPKYKHPSMQFDVNRAIRMVRHNAKSWGIDPTRVGVLGFSAGGHEASTAATHYDTGKQDGDEIDKQSCRPDIAVLIYPVITMTDPFTHKGSRTNLLGKEPDPALVEKMSNEKQVTKDTPPTFLVHSSDDKTVPIENSFLFAQALAKSGVPFTIVSFKTGAHGYGMGRPPETIAWPKACEAWLSGLGFFGKPAAAAK